MGERVHYAVRALLTLFLFSGLINDTLESIINVPRKV